MNSVQNVGHLLGRIFHATVLSGQNLVISFEMEAAVRYRVPCRVIAVTDIIITAISSVIIPITVVMVLTKNTRNLVSQYQEMTFVEDNQTNQMARFDQEEEQRKSLDAKAVSLKAAMWISAALIVTGWILTVMLMTVFAVQLLAAWQLWRSTKVTEADPLNATRRARCWRNVTTILTILLILPAALPNIGIILALLNIVLRIIGIVVVNKYIRHLDSLNEEGT